jgi:hypothetical protein
MLIEEKLSQFVEDASLLIVAGESSAKFYLAGNGVIEELDPFHLPKLHYSDREGFFARRGGQSNNSGSVYENPKEYLHKQFLHGLTDEVKHAQERHGFQSIYLFAPDYMMKGVKECLPKEFRDMLRLEFIGNLAAKHPLELLRLIKAEREQIARRQKIVRLEARKLLDTANV